jgi:hypothetical protein
MQIKMQITGHRAPDDFKGVNAQRGASASFIHAHWRNSDT